MKIGLIGTGNMGSANLYAVSKVIHANEIFVLNRMIEKNELIRDRLNVNI